MLRMQEERRDIASGSAFGSASRELRCISALLSPRVFAAQGAGGVGFFWRGFVYEVSLCL